LSPLKSTRIVMSCPSHVNRKMLIPYGLRLCFARVSMASVFAEVSLSRSPLEGEFLAAPTSRPW
jgi:hypothetical protein